ncbi:reverse transcriptase domain, reverse transcriptase zinc-binding domain protein [Tanacetum coccineum]
MVFGLRWCSWIKECLKSTSVSVLVNGSPSKEFLMEHGLRQGDPLSTLLFLIVAEALQVTILKACNKNIFKGLSLAYDGANVSILQYADNAIFFGKWSLHNVASLVKILKCLQDTYNLKVNLVKSKIYGIGVPREEVASLSCLIHYGFDSLSFIYLGLPIDRDMSKASSWFEVIDSFTRRLSSWKYKCLSIGSRLTLTKVVLGSLPLYYLSIFRAPLKVLSKLESIRNRFFWGIKDGKIKFLELNGTKCALVLIVVVWVLG